MRLTDDDIIRYCRASEDLTNGQFTIKPEKKSRGRSLTLINNRTKISHSLHGWMNGRECYEYLRAFYDGLRISELLVRN